MNPTLRYYEEHAQEFIEDTLHKQMHLQYALFEKYIRPDAKVLDAGCGSGRDSLYFKKKGYRVTAFDASPKMCVFAGQLLSQKVIQCRFDELDFNDEFDAVWASASLLHVSKKEMPETLQVLYNALKSEGILYLSFKYGEQEYVKDNRMFNSYTLEGFTPLLDPRFVHIQESLVLEDTRPERKGEFWLNLVLAINKG